MMSDWSLKRFTIGTLDEREWGRLIVYLQSGLGQSAYRSERDRTRGSRPKGREWVEPPVANYPPEEGSEVEEAPTPLMPEASSQRGGAPRVSRKTSKQGSMQASKEESQYSPSTIPSMASPRVTRSKGKSISTVETPRSSELYTLSKGSKESKGKKRTRRDEGGSLVPIQREIEAQEAAAAEKEAAEAAAR